MTATTTSPSRQTYGVQERSENVFALMLQHEHGRTVTALESARCANGRLLDSTQEFADSTERLAGLLGGFRLPS